jgi:hypothetical protein
MSAMVAEFAAPALEQMVHAGIAPVIERRGIPVDEQLRLSAGGQQGSR